MRLDATVLARLREQAVVALATTAALNSIGCIELGSAARCVGIEVTTLLRPPSQPRSEAAPTGR
jgi:hypothetical protein